NCIITPFLQLLDLLFINLSTTKPFFFYFYMRHRFTCISSNDRCNFIFFMLYIQLSCLIPLFKCCIKISLYLFKFALVILCLLLEVTHVYMFSLCFNRTFSTLQLIAFFIHIIIKFILQQTHLFFISKNFF